MLDVLERAERELPELLADEAGWAGLFIDYHPPTVERLWRAWGEYRLSLHRIHPCEQGAALFHPHPWPSAMRILSGEYEMAVGYGKGEAEPPVAARMIASGEFRYEMTDPDAWHYVRPIGGPSWSVMVTGRPWSRPAPRSEKPLGELTARQREEILAFFRARYPRLTPQPPPPAASLVAPAGAPVSSLVAPAGAPTKGAEREEEA